MDDANRSPLAECQALVQDGYAHLDQSDVAGAIEAALAAETALEGIENAKVHALASIIVGAILIDAGAADSDGAIVGRGTSIVETAIPAASGPNLPRALYNAASGHSALRAIRARRGEVPPIGLDVDYLRAKTLYREALEAYQNDSCADASHIAQAFVNYGNSLQAVGRFVEAIEQYEKASQLDGNVPEAWGARGMLLARLAPGASGHRHLYMAEAKRLMEESLTRSPKPQFAKSCEAQLAKLNRQIEAHSKFEIEERTLDPADNPFHDFSRRFCLKHRLYLSPTTLIGPKNSQLPGDPMFITQMTSSVQEYSKFDVCIEYLDQIKEDFVLARYLLVQSQYRSRFVETIDRDVTLYYPLNYSAHGAYIHMLRASIRLAIDTLDKIAAFTWSYAHMEEPELESVSFRNVWSSRRDPSALREPLRGLHNVYLLALLDLAADVRRDGYLSSVYDLRNALTHRFVRVVDGVPADAEADVPGLSVAELRGRSIQAVRLVRSAFMYLIMFVQTQEAKEARKDSSIALPFFGTKFDDVLRWHPHDGDLDNDS